MSKYLFATFCFQSASAEVLSSFRFIRRLNSYQLIKLKQRIQMWIIRVLTKDLIHSVASDYSALTVMEIKRVLLLALLLMMCLTIPSKAESNDPIKFCRCVKILRPTCGNDGTTYANPCLLRCEQRRNSRLAEAHDGACWVEWWILEIHSDQ